MEHKWNLKIKTTLAFPSILTCAVWGCVFAAIHSRQSTFIPKAIQLCNLNGGVVWYAYMAQTAASGGLYVTMAADKIYANRMTMTGSIGVIMSTTDTTGLQELIGIKEESITSGPNKAMGNPLTKEQREILQTMVDESYDFFVEIIVENRKLDEARVREIADGRIYSAAQAKELGLIDELATYEQAMQSFIDTYGFENCYIHHQSAPISTLEQILSSVEAGMESADVISNFSAINRYIEENQTPKLMYYMQ